MSNVIVLRMLTSSEEGFHSTSGASITTASSPSHSDYAGLNLAPPTSAAVAAVHKQHHNSLHALSRVDMFEQQMLSSTFGGLRVVPVAVPASLGLGGGSTGPRSDSGASSGENEGSDKGMREERLPGAWFYENGDGGSSPVHDDEFGLRAALSARNVTETVDVPSSEHVAEIVGRQGCKIKALRAKTNTYIKTPIRGEDPVFTVTGRLEDVAEAKKEIELAADHFTQIRATRKSTGAVAGMNTPGHITAYVRVPLRVVGLVVGPKGATIKRIQQDTNTYIITPSREREPIFEVTGLPNNVEVARKEIEQHIFQRTGNMPITDSTNAVTSAEMQTVLQSAAARAKFIAPGHHHHGASNAAAAAFAAAAARHFSPSAAAAHRETMMANEQFQMQSILRALNEGSMVPPPHSMSPGLFPPHHPAHFAAGVMPSSRSCTPPPPSMLASHAAYGVPPPSAWSAPLGIVTNSTGNVMAGLSSSDAACDWSNGGWTGVPPNQTALSHMGMEMLGGRMNGLALIPRDEGLGDSPPTTTKDSYSMMSSIWASSDMENTAPKSLQSGTGSSPVAIV